MKTTLQITPASKKLFIDYVEDACNWEGIPLVGGNVGVEPADKGNLTHLKKLGLITTETIPRYKGDKCGDIWLTFTEKGIEYASSLGYNL